MQGEVFPGLALLASHFGTLAPSVTAHGSDPHKPGELADPGSGTAINLRPIAMDVRAAAQDAET